MAAAFVKPMPGLHPIMADGGALARVCDLPIALRQELCRHLDVGGGWKDLAGAAGLSAIDVGVIESRCTRGSPADQLLTLWSQRNVPRVLELYTALHEKKRVYEAQLIEHLVPANYRVSIRPPEYSMELFTETGVHKEKVGQQKQAPSLSFVAPPSPREASDPGLSLGAAPSSAAVSCAPAAYTAPPAAPTGIAQRLAIPKFPYEELCASTRNFSDECLIGQGRFSRVYKCTMRNTTYAVKVKAAKSNDRNLDAELDLMQSYPHENILPIYGYCVMAENIFLCCQFMANGSLADRLSSTAVPLLCEQRCHIGVGIAKGLQYLHGLRDQPVIHGNVKSSNILLDNHLEAKLSDFALARRATSSSVTASVSGAAAAQLTHYTRQEGDPFGADAAYAAPELMEAVGCVQPSVKSDAYSFGIVLLEMCTGLKASASGGSSGGSAPDWLRTYVAGVCPSETGSGAADAKLRLADPRISWDRTFFLELLELAQSCCSNLKKRRPDMGQVFASLQRFDVGLQIRQRAAAEAASAGLLGPATDDRPAGESRSLGYELHGNSFTSSASTDVATLSVQTPTSTSSFSLPGGTPSLRSPNYIGEDSSTSTSLSSWSMGDGSSSSTSSSSVMSPSLESLHAAASNHSSAAASKLVHQPSEASETPDDEDDESGTPTTSTSAPGPLSAYMIEYGDASGSDENDADLLLQRFDDMSLGSNVPTESSLDDL